MKQKWLVFCAFTGIPISTALSANINCSGVCGSCQGGCVPGLLAVAILAVQAAGKKIAGKRRARYE